MYIINGFNDNKYGYQQGNKFNNIHLMNLKIT